MQWSLRWLLLPLDRVIGMGSPAPSSRLWRPRAARFGDNSLRHLGNVGAEEGTGGPRRAIRGAVGSSAARTGVITGTGVVGVGGASPRVQSRDGYLCSQVVFKAKAKRRPEMSRGLLAVRGAFVGASLLFLLVNALCAVLSRQRQAQPWVLLLVRVLVSDSLFVICALSLAACLCLVARRAPSTSIYLEAKGTSVCQAAAIGGAMVLLYASRACYNLAALALAPRSRLDAFDYDWYNVSDQADLVNDLGNKGYLVFGLILFVWELLPTALLVGFFRVHRPPQDLSTSRILSGQVFGSRSYFFDRAGHCEDEGCSWEHSRSESTSMSGSLGSGSWYGAIGREPGWGGASQTRTTPLLFSQVPRPGSHHHSLYSTPQT
ncbi:integral membrane protein GPR137 isoform X5 [Acomys russatus]|uniref:integral membrane protein GPR137 isoform X5 n=1 Tax=Acomys russatus TaxID=60746 RepID=UPI0021E299DE|nr:integral membrane protein GPR137 isoform X5 [Acomys russatus]